MPVSTKQVANGRRDHIVQLYEHDGEVVDAAARHLADAIRGEETAVVLATAAHRRALEAVMEAAGVDIARARGDGAWIAADAQEVLSRLLLDGRPDPICFHEVIGGLMAEAASSGRPVRVYGEMVALCWQAGQVPAAIELESLWNDLAHEHAFCLYCACPLRGDDDGHLAALHELCRLHSAVVGLPLPAGRGRGEPGAARETARPFAVGFDAPRQARRFVAQTLKLWGYDNLVDGAALVVGELAANAVVHARSPFTVAVSAREERVRVSVRDHSRRHPKAREWRWLASSGRGMRLVGAIADRWGADRVGNGKVVWAELCL